MRKYEAPAMKLDKFNLQNIVTTSGETPAKENAVAAANSYLNDVVKVENILKITL